MEEGIVRHGSLLLLVAALASGCAGTGAVPGEALDDHRDSARDLARAVDDSLAHERDRAYDNYVATLESGGSANPANVIMDFPQGDGAPFRWTLPRAPGFLAVEEAARRLERLNQLYIRYTDGLVALAGAEADAGDRLDSLARTLHRESRAFTDGLPVEPEGDERALFATAAATAARSWLESRRARDLAAVLKANQPAVEALARVGRQAAENAAIGVQDAYRDRTRRWVRRVGDAAAEEHPDLVAAQLDTNERVIARLDALAAIHEAYTGLAATHERLADGLTEQRQPELQGLAARVQAIGAAYRNLERVNGAGAGEAGPGPAAVP